MLTILFKCLVREDELQIASFQIFKYSHGDKKRRDTCFIFTSRHWLEL
jgi:hypothetical protein